MPSPELNPLRRNSMPGPRGRFSPTIREPAGDQPHDGVGVTEQARQAVADFNDAAARTEMLLEVR